MKLIYILLIANITYGQTKQEVKDYLNEINILFPDIVLQQAILETGHFKSYSCRVRKNLFGITRNGKLEIFTDWKISCDKYIKWIQYKYKEGDYYDFLTDIGYAEDLLYIEKLKSIKI